jgi:flavin-dependent dehydrogenase
VTKLKGAYVYLSDDYPLRDNIILIGDAGGFANRTTCEGLYDAFKTAEHAATAIIEKRPFHEVNAPVFRKMQNQLRVHHFLFSSLGFFFVKQMCRHPKAVKWLFDTKMRREKWI